MTEPQPESSTSPRRGGTGSLGAGIALAWVCFIAGYTLILTVGPGILFNHWLFVIAPPWIAMAGLAIYLIKTNRPRTAMGILVGVASILGVTLLLVAACFGILQIG